MAQRAALASRTKKPQFLRAAASAEAGLRSIAFAAGEHDSNASQAESLGRRFEERISAGPVVLHE